MRIDTLIIPQIGFIVQSRYTYVIMLGKKLRQDIFLGFIIFFSLLLIYLIPRILTIKSFPIFNDEAIYVRWAQEGYYKAEMRLLSLTDGKQPLYIWLITMVMHILPNPLAAGRIVSLLAGLGTMVGVGFAAYLLFKEKILVLLSLLIYALYPFAIILDRMALYDSLLATLYVWTLNISILFIQKPTLGGAFLLANILGAALLTKSTAALFFALIPLALLLRRSTVDKTMFPRYVLYLCIIIGFSFLYQSVLLLSPDAAYVATKNAIFTYPVSHIFTREGWVSMAINISTLTSWLVLYLTIPIVLVLLVPFFFIKKINRGLLFLLCSFGIPFLFIAAVGKTIFPRHIFFATIPLLLFAAWGIWQIFLQTKIARYRVLIFAAIFGGLLWTDYGIIHNFPTAAIPTIDTFQYANGAPAGTGIKEIVQYLQVEQTKGELTIATEGNYGSFTRTVIELYFFQSPNVHMTDISENARGPVPEQISEAGKIHPVYIIFNTTQQIPNWPMEKIKEIKKGVGTDYIRLYRFTPEIIPLNH